MLYLSITFIKYLLGVIIYDKLSDVNKIIDNYVNLGHGVYYLMTFFTQAQTKHTGYK